MNSADGKTTATSGKNVVINRLKRVEGQVRGLIRMVEEGKDCGDVLIQIGSAKSALHKAGQLMLEDYVSRCFLVREEGDDAGVIRKLFAAIEQFSRIV